MLVDVLNLQDDDKLPLNSLHILEECNIPTIRCSQDKHKIDTDCGIGQPTCNKSNSMIDYALISPTLFRSVVDFNVLIFDLILSDICGRLNYIVTIIYNLVNSYNISFLRINSPKTN
jgi:hypothetical protein